MSTCWYSREKSSLTTLRSVGKNKESIFHMFLEDVPHARSRAWQHRPGENRSAYVLLQSRLVKCPLPPSPLLLTHLLFVHLPTRLEFLQELGPCLPFSLPQCPEQAPRFVDILKSFGMNELLKPLLGAYSHMPLT